MLYRHNRDDIELSVELDGITEDATYEKLLVSYYQKNLSNRVLVINQDITPKIIVFEMGDDVVPSVIPAGAVSGWYLRFPPHLTVYSIFFSDNATTDLLYATYTGSHPSLPAECVLYNGSSLEGISEYDFNNRQTLIVQQDFNQVNKVNVNLTPRYFMDSTKVTQDKKYYIFMYAVDLNGNVSADTNIIGLNWEGDSTRTESMLRYFTIKGYR